MASTPDRLWRTVWLTATEARAPTESMRSSTCSARLRPQLDGAISGRWQPRPGRHDNLVQEGPAKSAPTTEGSVARRARRTVPHRESRTLGLPAPSNSPHRSQTYPLGTVADATENHENADTPTQKCSVPNGSPMRRPGPPIADCAILRHDDRRATDAVVGHRGGQRPARRDRRHGRSGPRAWQRLEQPVHACSLLGTARRSVRAVANGGVVRVVDIIGSPGPPPTNSPRDRELPPSDGRDKREPR